MEIIFFYAHICDHVAFDLISKLDAARRKGIDTIYLLMQTDGGETGAGFAIHNFIKASGVKVVAVNMGMVNSMGPVVYSAASHRIAMPQATFSFHPNSFELKGWFDVCQLEEKVNVLRKEHERMAESLSSATGQPVEAVRRLIFDRLSLSANDAKAFGLVHEIQEFQIPKDAEITFVDDKHHPQPVGPMPFGPMPFGPGPRPRPRPTQAPKPEPPKTADG